MSLEIRVNCKSGRGFSEKNVDEKWFTDEERAFLNEHEVLVEAYEQYTSDDCESYDEYLERQNCEYIWKYSIYVDNEYKRSDEANSYDYVTSHITEQVIR